MKKKQKETMNNKEARISICKCSGMNTQGDTMKGEILTGTGNTNN